MSRLNTEEIVAETRTVEGEESKFHELISTFYFNKQELDSYTKICKDLNSQIKDGMSKRGTSKYDTGEYTATVSEAHKETFNEEALIPILKKYGIDVAVKTREYIDYDVLEEYLYAENQSPDLTEIISEIERCKSDSVTVRLTVKKNKTKGE